MPMAATLCWAFVRVVGVEGDLVSTAAPVGPRPVPARPVRSVTRSPSPKRGSRPRLLQRVGCPPPSALARLIRGCRRRPATRRGSHDVPRAARVAAWPAGVAPDMQGRHRSRYCVVNDEHGLRARDAHRASAEPAMAGSGVRGGLRLRAMAQNFLWCDREQELLLPPSLREWLPEDHLAWFVLEAVETMDLKAFLASYRGDGWGRAAHDPTMMVALLLYAYATGDR